MYAKKAELKAKKVRAQGEKRLQEIEERDAKKKEEPDEQYKPGSLQAWKPKVPYAGPPNLSKGRGLPKRGAKGGMRGFSPDLD